MPKFFKKDTVRPQELLCVLRNRNTYLVGFLGVSFLVKVTQITQMTRILSACGRGKEKS